MTKAQQSEQNEARATLREMLKPGDTVYTVLRHVSRSGMSRRIDLYAIQDGAPRWLSGYVKTALGYPRTKFDAITVGGCGMDMGFHLVSTLSRVLYPEGFGCIGQGPNGGHPYCPSNDHSNGDRDYTRHEDATARECPACKGTGTREIRFRHGEDVITEQTECRTCHGDKTLPEGHWHRSGDYALRHTWM